MSGTKSMEWEKAENKSPVVITSFMTPLMYRDKNKRNHENILNQSAMSSSVSVYLSTCYKG